jgi:hypothetical protein
VVEDAADDAALGNERDHPHHASAAGTGGGIDLVHPSNELSPATTQGDQRRGRGGTRRRSVFARPWRERLCLLGLAAGLQLAAHDVRVGAEVVDEVAARIGDVGEKTGDEVEGIEGLGLLGVVADPGLVCGSG